MFSIVLVLQEGIKCLQLPQQSKKRRLDDEIVYEFYRSLKDNFLIEIWKENVIKIQHNESVPGGLLDKIYLAEKAYLNNQHQKTKEILSLIVKDLLDIKNQSYIS